jgi:polynucleotide 5'-hydroxyl-kinase GRC3/NOL9
MNRTLEKGKTLLVDGPASVITTSGKVEVFGYSPSSTSKIVIREGKRLPFVVEENASFTISLGENADIEETNGSTIPPSWTEAFEELQKIQSKPIMAIVLGTADSGKTSFCTYLINKLIEKKDKVAILDGDLGQSDIGPPCTVAYAFVTKPLTDLFNLEAKNAFFVGITSPSTATNKVIDGLTTLKKEVLNSNPNYVIVNTDGWTEGEEAANYKIQLVKKLNPEIIFCIQQKDELATVLNSLKDFKTVTVESPSTIRQRSREKRRSLRELGYIKYLRNAKVQSIPKNWIEIEDNEFGLDKTNGNIRQARKIYEFLGMKPLHLAEFKRKISIFVGKTRWISQEAINKVEEFTQKKVEVVHKGEEEGFLMALYNDERKFLGIGVLQEVDYRRQTLKILTPVSKKISVVALGKVKLDKNFKESLVIGEENSADISSFRRLF